MPTPVRIHAKIIAPTPADAAIFWGRLKIPPPIMELMTMPAKAMAPRFFPDLLPLEIMYSPYLIVTGSAFSKLRNPNAVNEKPYFCLMLM
ncbi:Uncharacterised protein [Chlamydia abortus]|nr:Uncharacterised protein [Chlamydia abortus]